jgi:hypothetical protein
MTPDERVGRVLAEMTEDLKPGPDPYGRVRARHRRLVRRRAAAAGLAVAAVASVVGARIGDAGPDRGLDQPPVSESDQQWSNVVAWSDRLFDSPPRGTVSSDHAYVTALGERMLQEQRSGHLPLKTPAREVRVLFVDDVGDFRVALVAFARANPQPNFWPQAAVWLAARRGASVQELSTPSAVRGSSDGLGPSERIMVDDPAKPGSVVHVAIAPQECAFQTAAWPAVKDWQAATTGSYLVRTEQTMRPEWWRIICGGQTRETDPGPGSLAPNGMTTAQLDAALSRNRGTTVDGQRLREAVSSAAQEWGYSVAALPQVVWTGRTAGSTPGNGISYDGQVTVIAAPAAGGGWVGWAIVSYDQPGAGNSMGNSSGFRMRTDPADPSTVVAIPLGDNILVIAPDTATAVRGLRNGREVANAMVHNHAALLKTSTENGIIIQAIDDQADVIVSATPASQPGPLAHGEDTWHQE